MANNKHKFKIAWNYLNSCTYFAKPYYNSDGSFITFNNEFKESLDIDVCENFVWLECGSWSLDSKVWYHDYKLNTKGTSFEKAIVKLYRKIYKICGEDYIDDYFHIDDKAQCHWDVDKVLKKINEFNKYANKQIE